MRMTRPAALHSVRSRRGSLLVVVLVVVVFLTLAAANYSAWMTTELEATRVAGSDIQARMLADSGAEYIASVLANRGTGTSDNLLHNPEQFLGVPVIESERDRARGRFTVIAPLEQGNVGLGIRYGLIDESGKLNLNRLDQMALDDEQSRTLLMRLPGMTEEIADAIRDWIDSDDTSRDYGVESEYYESLNPPYAAKNGPLESLDELLLVRGVTPELLYGEDANRNGLLDPNEDDGDFSPPYDNVDGVLDLGWQAYLTTVSRELNLRPDGTSKIDVNNGILSDLYDELEAEFGEDVAKFVVAYRMGGPKDQPPDDETSSGGLSSSSTAGQQRQQLERQVTGAVGQIAGAALSPGGTVTRGGMDLARGAQFQVKSLWELMDPATSRTDATVDGREVELVSPWTPDAATIPLVMEALTTTSDTYLEGRININQARPEILAGLPNMTSEVVSAIVASQPVDAAGQPVTAVIEARKTTGWLYTEGLVDIWTMRALDPYITARGDVYRAQVLGFFEGGGPVSRIEVVIDATQTPPRITFHRDLDDLGRGYTREQMYPTAQ